MRELTGAMIALLLVLACPPAHGEAIIGEGRSPCEVGAPDPSSPKAQATEIPMASGRAPIPPGEDMCGEGTGDSCAVFFEVK